MGVVDLLEVIDVQDQEGQGRAAGPRLVQRLAGGFVQVTPVMEAGQGIEQGQLLELIMQQILFLDALLEFPGFPLRLFGPAVFQRRASPLVKGGAPQQEENGEGRHHELQDRVPVLTPGGQGLGDGDVHHRDHGVVAGGAIGGEGGLGREPGRWGFADLPLGWNPRLEGEGARVQQTGPAPLVGGKHQDGVVAEDLHLPALGLHVVDVMVDEEIAVDRRHQISRPALPGEGFDGGEEGPASGIGTGGGDGVAVVQVPAHPGGAETELVGAGLQGWQQIRQVDPDAEVGGGGAEEDQSFGVGQGQGTQIGGVAQRPRQFRARVRTVALEQALQGQVNDPQGLGEIVLRRPGLEGG